MRGLAPLLLALAAGCGGSEGAEEARVPPSVLLISIDTLRADRLGCYGYERATSPALDRLAASGARFAHVVAESPWTIPSHVTMLSGLHPATHGVVTPDDVPAEEIELLAERLGDAGYYTFAITDGGWLAPEQGFGQGFRSFQDRRQGFAATLAQAREILTFRRARGGGPSFGFLHTYDVHCPYDPPEPYRSMFRSRGRAEFAADGLCGNPDLNAMDLTAEQALYLSDRYDGGIRRMDEHLEGFTRWLAESGAFADTIVVLTSDHGDEFLEHGQIGHERSLHRELLMVPLIVVAPGVPPRVIDEPVGLADLVPTILELCGLSAPADLDGRSLVPLLSSGPDVVAAADAPRLSRLDWQRRLDSSIEPGWHLIVDRASGASELYDLAADPTEQRNLAFEELDRAAAMRERLESRMEALEAGRISAERRAQPDEARRRELDGLGYGGESR